MKLLIEQSSDCAETEIKITCSFVDERLKRLIEEIKLFSFSIPVQKDGRMVSVALENVYYFDTVDNKTFLYTDKEVYQCGRKLYELEAQFANTPFVRISKNSVLNTSYVDSVRTQFNGRLEAVLANGEKAIVSKHYLKAFRDKFIKGAKP
jgi:DNA-binding LytR/AlgR family response regulator